MMPTVMRAKTAGRKDRRNVARWLRRIGIAIGILLFIIALCLSGLFLYLDSNHAQRWIQTRINHAIPGQLAWAHSRFSFIRGEFEFGQVVLQDASEREIAELDRICIDLSWLALLKQRITIQKLEVDRPSFRLSQNEDGALNLVQALAPSDARSDDREKPAAGYPLNIVLESGRIKHGSIRYGRDSGQIAVHASDIELAAGGDLQSQSGRIDIVLGNGSIRSPELQTELKRLGFSAEYQQGSLRGIVLKGNTASSDFLLKGRIDDLPHAPQLDLDLALNLSLPEVSEIFGISSLPDGDAAILLELQGVLSNPQANLNLAYSGGHLFNSRIEGAMLDIHLADRLLLIRALQVEAAGGMIHAEGKVDFRAAFPNGFLAAGYDPEQIAYEVNLKEQEIELSRLPGMASRLSGRIQSEIHIAGKGVSPGVLTAQAKMGIVGSKVTLDTSKAIAPFRIDAEADIRRGLLKLNRLHARLGENTAQSTGSLDLKSHDFSVLLTADLPDLHSVLAAAGMDKSTGKAAVRIAASGSTTKPRFDVKLTGSQLLLGDVSLGDIELAAALDDSGVLDVAQITVRNQGTAIAGRGFLELLDSDSKFSRMAPLGLVVDFSGLDPAHFLSTDEIAGTFAGNLSLEGQLNDLRARMTVHGENLGFRNVPIGHVDASLRLLRGILHIDRMDIRRAKSVFELTGMAHVLDGNTLKPYSDPKFQLKLESTALAVEDFVAGSQGSLSVALQAAGSARHPEGTLRLAGAQVGIYDRPLGKIELVCRFDDERLWVDTLQILPAPAQLLEGTGWLAYSGGYQFNMTGRGISLQQIEKLRAAGITEGTLNLDFRGSGTLQDPGVEGELAMANVRISGKELADIAMNISIRDHVARLSGNPGFDLFGTYHIQRKDFDVSMQMRDTDLSPYFKLFDRPDLSGRLSGQIAAAGKLDKRDSYRGVVDISVLDLGYQNEAVVRSGEVKMAFGGQTLGIQRMHLVFPDHGRFDLQGDADLDGAFLLEGGGIIPLSIASLFSEDLPDAKGELSVDARIKGSRRHAEVRVDIGLTDAGVTLPVLSQQLHGVNGKINVTSKSVALQSITGRLDNGRFELAGWMQLDDRFMPSELLLDLKADALPLEVPETLDFLVNAQLRIQGTPDNTRMDGDMVLLEGVYYKDVNLGLLDAVGEKKRRTSLPRPELTLPYLRNMALNVAVKHRKPFTVDNNIAQMEIIPDLRLSGTLNRPNIDGRAAVQSGSLAYQRKVFAIKKGVVDFLDPYSNVPTLDIKGDVQVRNWLIMLAVAGTPDQLVFSLSSDPPLEHGDILSLLVIGKTTGDMIRGEGGSTQSAAQMLTRLFSEAAGDRIKGITGFEIVETDMPAAGGSDTADGVTVTLGKKLSDRMMLKYSVGSKQGEMIQQAIAEYMFLQNIVLSGFQSGRGAFGGSIKYRVVF